MSDDAPENLRKFLESDDPAMVRMGLSMAKGSGVPEELLPTILGLYMWNDDKSVRAAAKSVFNKYAPAEIQATVKENWKASYRTLLVTGYRFPEAVRPLVQAFKSQDDFAEIALVPLIKALRDGDEKAAEALGCIGGGRAVERLIKALSDDDKWVRKAAAEALGKIGIERAVVPLIGVLSDDDWRTRNSAAEALGKIGDEQAVEPLIKALRDRRSVVVRRGAAEALGKIGDVHAVEPLINALGDDDDDDVRQNAARALGEIGVARAVEPLIKALGVCESAAEALGEIGKPAVEPLINALGDEDDSVRYRAAGALGNIGDVRAVEPLINALGDENEDVCSAAVAALGNIGDERAIEPLIKALGDNDWWVRSTAARALGMIGEPAVEPLIEVLSGGDMGVGRRDLGALRCLPSRAYAAGALGEIGDARAVEPLIKMLSDGDSDVRKSTARALDKLGWVPETDEQRAAYLIAVPNWESLVEWGEPAVEALIGVLSDDVWRVREYAARALGKIGDERAVEALIKALGDEFDGARDAAKEALRELGHEVE